MQVPPQHHIMVKIADPEFAAMYDCIIRDPDICRVVFEEFLAGLSVKSFMALYRGLLSSQTGSVIQDPLSHPVLHRFDI